MAHIKIAFLDSDVGSSLFSHALDLFAMLIEALLDLL